MSPLEQPVEVEVTITRIVLQGEDPRRFMELLQHIRSGNSPRQDHMSWASAMLAEIKEEAFR